MHWTWTDMMLSLHDISPANCQFHTHRYFVESQELAWQGSQFDYRVGPMCRSRKIIGYCSWVNHSRAMLQSLLSSGREQSPGTPSSLSGFIQLESLASKCMIGSPYLLSRPVIFVPRLHGYNQDFAQQYRWCFMVSSIAGGWLSNYRKVDEWLKYRHITLERHLYPS